MNKDDKAKGTELRDRSWSMINRSVLDLPPRFISDMTSSGQPIQTTPVNGLIHTQKGYYRLAEDTRDGTRVLLHSYERDQLVGDKQRDRDGSISIKRRAAEDYHIYGISARKVVAGGIFRDDLNHDMRFLEHSFQRDLNLHVMEVEAVKGDKKREIVNMANGRGAFGIFEGDKGKWRVRYYRNLRRGQDPADRFTTIDDDSGGSFFRRLFSMGRDVKEFNSYPEALKYVRREWNKMSMQIYRGKPVEYESPNLRVKMMAKFLDFMDGRKYRDWIIATAVGVGSAILASPHVALGWETLLGGLGGAAWVVGGHAVENFLYDKWLKHAAVDDNKRMEQLKPYFEQNDIDNYLIQTPENEARFRHKLDPKVIPHLRLLNHEEADMNYDSGEFTPNVNPQRPIEDLSSIAYRQFGTLFDSSQADKGLLAALYPNGLVTLTEVNPKTHATRHYITYRKDFNEMAVLDHPHIVDVSVDKLPSPGPIHKITHKQGRMLAYVGMSPEEFMSDLMHKVGPDARNIRFFGMKMTDLFNVKGAEKLRPRTKDSQTLVEIEESRIAAAAIPADDDGKAGQQKDAPATDAAVSQPPPVPAGASDQPVFNHVTFVAPEVRVPGLS